MITWQEVLEKEPTDDCRKYADMCCGITVYRQARALIAMLPDDKFRVLSTGYFNGGFTDSPKAVINMSSLGGNLEYQMMVGNRSVVGEYTAECFRKLGFDPADVVAEGTAANMENASVGTLKCGSVPVSVAITAGIRGNGGCAGDPASFDEAKRYMEKNGTIVMIMSVEAELSDSAMLQLMNIMVQAKSCVIQEFQAKSLYSHRIATGSGTDQIAIISRKGATRMESVRIDSDFAIGVVDLVKENLSRAFDWQSAMTPSTQCDAMVQLSRFGIKENLMEDEIRFPNRMRDLVDAKKIVFPDPYVVSVFTAALRIQDAIDAGTVDGREGLVTAKKIVDGALSDILPHTPVYDARLEHTESIPEHMSLILAMLMQYRATVLWEARE